MKHNVGSDIVCVNNFHENKLLKFDNLFSTLLLQNVGTGVGQYKQLSKFELESFTEMFSVFNDLILSMVRSAVHVLPKDKENNKPSATAHLRVNQATKHNQEYEKFIDIKEVFLSCFKDKHLKNTFSSGISGFVLKPCQDRKDFKIKIRVSKKFISELTSTSQRAFIFDIKILENILNKINDNFNKLLPEAQTKGRLKIQQIRQTTIPKKAKYTGREKGVGI